LLRFAHCLHCCIFCSCWVQAFSILRSRVRLVDWDLRQIIVAFHEVLDVPLGNRTLEEFMMLVAGRRGGRGHGERAERSKQERWSGEVRGVVVRGAASLIREVVALILASAGVCRMQL
jgi:hypothetical protein